MPKPISWKKLVKNFKKLGFDGPYSGGRHFFMKKGALKVRIPNKHGNTISAGLISEILHQASIGKKQWDDL